MGPSDTPSADVAIDVELVRSLLRDQLPDLGDLPIEAVGSGWDNALFRVGDDLVARLPRRAIAADLVDREAAWLPLLAPRLPLPVPTPVGLGRPSEVYPWRWTVCPWFEGDPATDAPFDDEVEAAATIGGFLAALGTPAPDDAPTNPWRGVPLAHRDRLTRDAVDAVGPLLDRRAVLAAWDDLRDAPAWPGPPVWVHGDLHPGNVVVRDGRLAAVLDFGDLCAGDPATDLTIAWDLFGVEGRAALRAAAGVDDDTWRRGLGWGLTIGLAVVRSSADNPAYTAFGRRAITSVLAAHAAGDGHP